MFARITSSTFTFKVNSRAEIMKVNDFVTYEINSYLYVLNAPLLVATEAFSISKKIAKKLSLN